MNDTLLPQVQAAGGKIYPPLTHFIREQWQERYSSETWQRFGAAKKQFDPINVLTPGVGIFSA